MLNDAENVVSDESEGLASAEQEATDELCEKIDALADELPIATRLILPHLDRLSFSDLQYIADKLDTYRAEVMAMLEQNREERLQELKERIERDKAELAALSPVPVAAGKAKMENPSTPKYRDPAKPENTWAGRGKKPTWLTEKLESGANLEDFLIDKPVVVDPVPEDTGF
ncbi:MAG: H-NS histone family protein [Vampirovibrionales bacterium]|nr:H-NS histone family protein [Vampirovibrionales bacterium]